MPDAKLHCRLLSPDGALFEGDADVVVVTTELGELAVYPGHAPLVSSLGIGEVRVRAGDAVTAFAILRGYVKVNRGRVDVMVTLAVPAAAIDAGALQKELETLAATKPHTDEQFLERFERQDWVYARKRIKERAS